MLKSQSLRDVLRNGGGPVNRKKIYIGCIFFDSNDYIRMIISATATVGVDTVIA